MSEIPLIVKQPIVAYLGHRCRVGTFDFTAVSGDFVDTEVVLNFDVDKTVVLTLRSEDSDVEWAGGSIVDLELTDEQIATLAAAGKEVRCIITLESADVEPELDPLAIFTVKIND